MARSNVGDIFSTSRHLKPGGRIELSEGRTHMVCDDGTYPETSFTYKWIVRWPYVEFPEIH